MTQHTFLAESSAFVPTVFWLTGLSGAGKTTISTQLTQALRDQGHPVILLDGDTLREVFQDTFGHDQQQRLLASQQYARLCNMLVKQQTHVVCATISMFHATQAWNREHITHYLEIFINVPMSELITRNNKQIYSRGLAGDLTNIVGIDIEPEYPRHPDLTIDNFGDMTTEHAVAMILNYYQSTVKNNLTIKETNP